jgi:hypothetical protein
MTSVRQGAGSARDTSTKRAKKAAAPTAAKASTPKARATKTSPARGGRRDAAPPASSVAQVRLQADEIAELRDAMRQLSLTSTSEALREGIRLLVNEARQIAAAHEIQTFYGGGTAPLPDGVVPATEEELAAADAEPW